MRAIALMWIALLLASSAVHGQTTTVETFKSSILHADRQLRIQLPDGYETTPAARYPLILVFDGEYLFYSVTGASVILGMYEAAPEVIVVAIDQNHADDTGDSARWADGQYDRESGQLRPKGLAFKSFVTDELLPYLDRTYRTTAFRVVVGHSFTATDVHFFLLDKNPAFQGYIAISPYLPVSLHEPIAAAAGAATHDVFYFASTGSNDLKLHREMLTQLDSQRLSSLHNPNFHYLFEDYPGADHMSVVNLSVETALMHVFSEYAVVRDAEEKRSDFVAAPLEYLQEKYARIKRIYGLELPRLRPGDLAAAQRAVEAQENWPELRKLGELTMRAYPSSPQGDLMIGEYYEHVHQHKKAVAAEQKGCEKLPAASRSRRQCEQTVAELQKALHAAARS